MITRDFLGMGFCGGKHLTSQDRAKFFENWDKMPDSEKLEMINKRIEAFKKGKDCEKDFFSVEHFDSHCKEWMSKTPEEKNKFVEDLKKSVEERHTMMKERFSDHGIGFGFHDRGRECTHPSEG